MARKPAKNTMVSFSKRRHGLYEKASKLCLLSNAQIAILVLSSAGNPFAFGHSSVDGVLRRFLGETTTPEDCRFIITDKQRQQEERVQGLKRRIKELRRENPESKKIKAWIQKESEACTTLEELEFLKHKYMALHENVNKRLQSRRPSNDMSYSLGKCGGSVANSGFINFSSSFNESSYSVEEFGCSGGASSAVSGIINSSSSFETLPSVNYKSYAVGKFRGINSSSSFVVTSYSQARCGGTAEGAHSSVSGVIDPSSSFDSVAAVTGSENYMSYPVGKFVGINSSSSSVFGEGIGDGDGVGPFSGYDDFDFVGMTGYSTFNSIPDSQTDVSYVSPLATLMDSSGDMSFSVEEILANCGSDSLNDMSYPVEKCCASCGSECIGDGEIGVVVTGGGCSGPFSIAASMSPIDMENDMSLMKFSETNFGSNSSVEGMSDDEVFDHLGHLNFNWFSV